MYKETGITCRATVTLTSKCVMNPVQGHLTRTRSAGVKIIFDTSVGACERKVCHDLTHHLS